MVLQSFSNPCVIALSLIFQGLITCGFSNSEQPFSFAKTILRENLCIVQWLVPSIDKHAKQVRDLKESLEELKVHVNILVVWYGRHAVANIA